MSYQKYIEQESVELQFTDLNLFISDQSSWQTTGKRYLSFYFVR